MSEWIKVVTQPLGLAGFALFLVFGALAKIKQKDERRWLAPAAFGIAALGLAGCMLLAWAQIPKPAPPAVQQAAGAKPDCQPATQISTGAGSPNVNCTTGNVTITVDQSSGTKPVTPPAAPAQAAPVKQ